MLLLLAAAAGVLGTAEVLVGRAWWGVLAALCSTLAATTTAWGTLIGCEENARLYRAARVALDPLKGPLEHHPADLHELLAVVVRAQEILQAETSQVGPALEGERGHDRPHLGDGQSCSRGGRRSSGRGALGGPFRGRPRDPRRGRRSRRCLRRR